MGYGLKARVRAKDYRLVLGLELRTRPKAKGWWLAIAVVVAL